MVTTILILSVLLIVLSLLPFIQNQHWIFRVPEFIKLQILVLQIVVFATAFFYVRSEKWFWIVQVVQSVLIGYHVYILMSYTKFWKNQNDEMTDNASDKIKIISCNIYQFNSDYQRFIVLIQKEQPDVFLTMESNSD